MGVAWDTGRLDERARAPGDVAHSPRVPSEMFHIPAPLAQALELEVAAMLRPALQSPEAYEPLLATPAELVTLYFDTPGRALYRRARSGAPSVRLRARLHRDRASEPPPGPDGRPPAGSSLLWVELEHRNGLGVERHRICLPRLPLLEFLHDGRTSAVLRQAGAALREAAETLAVLLALRSNLGEPLAVSCVVRSQRTTYRSQRAEWQLTFDRELATFAAPEETWAAKGSLPLAAMGQPRHARRGETIVGFECSVPTPGWLAAALHRAATQAVPFDEFLVASRALDTHP